jgi:hypothetical protein
MIGLLALPDWERFTTGPQGPSIDCAEALLEVKLTAISKMGKRKRLRRVDFILWIIYINYRGLIICQFPYRAGR